MTSRSKERCAGALIAALGLVATVLVWRTAHAGRPFMQIGTAGPAFVVIGLALVLMPGYRSERLARGEDISQLSGWDLITPRWKVVTITAIALSIGYYLLLRPV